MRSRWARVGTNLGRASSFTISDEATSQDSLPEKGLASRHRIVEDSLFPGMIGGCRGIKFCEQFVPEVNKAAVFNKVPKQILCRLA